MMGNQQYGRRKERLKTQDLRLKTLVFGLWSLGLWLTFGPGSPQHQGAIDISIAFWDVNVLPMSPQHQGAIDIATYVPLDNGRTWTYQWTIRYEDGRQETTSRTKSFEGPEFLATGYAYRFMSDLGDYVLLSVDNGQLRMHGSVEPHRQIRFTFDPPVVLYSPDMELERPYTIIQQAEDGSGTRTWTTVVDGLQKVTTPMGQFHDCVKIRLAMDSSQVKTRATYFYARGLGLVAYQYEAWAKNKDRAEVTIEAGLKLAQLAGHTLTSASQLENLKSLSSPTRLDDAEARKLFQQTYQGLYFWPAKFPGFQASFTLRHGEEKADESAGVPGIITVSPDLKMKVSGGEKQTRIQVETEMSQFITHLKDKPFENEFKDAVISFAERDPVQGAKIEVSAGQTMGTSYRIKDGEIHQIGHSYGRVRFLVNHTEFMKTDSGRLIPRRFSIMYYSNETNQLIAQVDFQDEYTIFENLWLPRRRVKTETTKQGTTTLVIEFTNHQILK
jgi:hypothetical protein